MDTFPSTEDGVETTRMKIDDFLEKECRTRAHFHDRQPGWPQLAAMPDKFQYMDVMRNFSYIGMRTIAYKGGRLAFLEATLDELDAKENDHWRGLTEYQKRLPGQPTSKGNFDELMAMIIEERNEYADAVFRQKKLLSLYSVPDDHWRSAVGYVLDEGMLDSEGRRWFSAPGEACFLSKPLPKLMTWLLHSRLRKLLAKLMAPLGSRGQSRAIPLDQIHLIVQVTIIVGSLLPLVPIGVLFLGSLTNVQMFGVVVGSTALFIIAITASQEMAMHTALLAVCAFGAILATVMVQSASGVPVS